MQTASADEYYRGSLKDGPVVAQGYNWSGFYGGVNAGYTWNNWDWPSLNPYVAPPKPCGDCGPPNQNLSGAMLGGTVGYNHQIDRFVIGVEGDFNFANISDSQRDGNYLVETSKIEHFATIRARAGLLLTPALLAYATGGVAFQDLEYGESCPSDASAVTAGWCRSVANGGHGPYSLSKSQWNTGYVVGGGLEWMIAERVSLKVEGLYADFGTNDYQLGLMADGKPLPKKSIENSETMLKVGVNYHF
ncbi:outer membrane protein [Hyphomicrobium denitrificans]|uniref:outer membrane protein n=1 Tax=Hyphomicrobium denitrificans TaxID=53399 RepID=UPI0016513CF4|nr:outer membrane beta-barrel protein [Hyphomicrobium denitrificans]